MDEGDEEEENRVGRPARVRMPEKGESTGGGLFLFFFVFVFMPRKMPPND